MSTRIAVLITDEFEDSEFTSPAEVYKRAGYEVVTIEEQAGKTVKGKQGDAEVTIDRSIDDVSPAEFDALLLPVAPLPAFPTDLQYPTSVAGVAQPDYLGWMRTATYLTVTGHPVISMPAGFSSAGTPLGVQIVGRHRAERALLSIAKGFENVTGFAARRPALG